MFSSLENLYHSQKYFTQYIMYLNNLTNSINSQRLRNKYYRITKHDINWLDSVSACPPLFIWNFPWPGAPMPQLLYAFSCKLSTAAPYLENHPQLTRLIRKVLPPSLPWHLLHAPCSQWLINMEIQKANPIPHLGPVLRRGSC